MTRSIDIKITADAAELSRALEQAQRSVNKLYESTAAPLPREGWGAATLGLRVLCIFMLVGAVVFGCWVLSQALRAHTG
jgi:hypothetical protein